MEKLQCPVTCGVKTAMTIGTWNKLCQRKRDAAINDSAWNFARCNGQTRWESNTCLICQGTIPKEVTIIGPRKVKEKGQGATPPKRSSPHEYYLPRNSMDSSREDILSF